MKVSMNPILPNPSPLERIIVGVLAAGVVLAVLSCRADATLRFVVAANPVLWLFVALLLACVGAPLVIAWRNGLRWLFSRRALRFHVWLVGGFLTGVVLLYATERWRGKRAWAVEARRLAERGEILSLAELVPPEVPAAQNFVEAPAFQELFGSEMLKSTSWRRPPVIGWPNGRSVDLKPWTRVLRGQGSGETVSMPRPEEWQPAASSSPPASTNAPPPADELASARALLDALGPYETRLRSLAEAAAARPEARLRHRQPVPGFLAMDLPKNRTDGVRNAAVLLSLRASARLAAGETDAALEDVLLALRLADVFQGEPYSQALDTRCEILMLALQPAWEGMARHRWSAPQLARMQDKLAAIELRPDLLLALRGERALSLAFLDRFLGFLEGRTPLRSEPPAYWDDRFVEGVVRAITPVGWAYQSKAMTCQWFEPGFRAATGQSNRVARVVLMSEFPRWGDPIFFTFICPRLRWVVEGSLPRAACVQTLLGEAVAACAVERHRLAQGNYPNRLDDLVPGLLRAAPGDWASGAPVKYEVTDGKGFLLEAAGWPAQRDRRARGSERQFRDPLPDWFVEGTLWIWAVPGE